MPKGVVFSFSFLITPSRFVLYICRCNASKAERRVWLDIAGCHATTLCVQFCYSRELCLQRGDHRLDHPTLRPGRMTNAMDQMAKDMQTPSLQVGIS